MTTIEPLDPRLLTAWRLVVAAVAGIVAVAAFAIGGLFAAGADDPPVWLWVGAAAMPVAVAVAGLVIASVTFRHWGYAVGEEGLELHHGVVVRVHSSVPYHRVQQIDVTAGPLDRLLDVRQLVIRTASATSDATIPGLARERADDLRRQILHRAGEGDAV